MSLSILQGGAMFHFIVKGAGWTSDRDTIDRSRVLEYTEDLRYLNNGEGRLRLQDEVVRRLRTLTGRD
jgi:hypothetical protein